MDVCAYPYSFAHLAREPDLIPPTRTMPHPPAPLLIAEVPFSGLSHLGFEGIRGMPAERRNYLARDNCVANIVA